MAKVKTSTATEYSQKIPDTAVNKANSRAITGLILKILRVRKINKIVNAPKTAESKLALNINEPKGITVVNILPIMINKGKPGGWHIPQ